MKRYSFLLALLLVFAILRQLLAQHRDTLYVVEEEPIYDTLFVHDTLRTYDTVAVNDHAGNADSPEFYKFSVGLSYCALGADRLSNTAFPRIASSRRISPENTS